MGLEAALGDDTPIANFVKITEEHRRERERRLDAGDETAEIKFPKQSESKSGGAGGKSGSWGSGGKGSSKGKGGKDGGKGGKDSGKGGKDSGKGGKSSSKGSSRAVGAPVSRQG